jgi:hypothetical protein
MQLSSITPGSNLVGVEPGLIVSVIAAVPLGPESLKLIYQRPVGDYRDRLISQTDADAFSVAVAERPWAFDGKGEDFKLAVEAKRIDLAFLFDPMMAVHTSSVQPLQHQIAAVYESMLPRQPLRYVLADDPGAAKAYRASVAPTPVVQEAAPTQVELGGLQTAAQTASQPGSTSVVYSATTPGAPVSPGASVAPSSPKMKSFHGTVEVNAATARARLLQIAEEVISQLVSDPMAKVTVNVEISAEFPQGAAEQVRRAVSENATNLKFKVSEWEK